MSKSWFTFYLFGDPTEEACSDRYDPTTDTGHETGSTWTMLLDSDEYNERDTGCGCEELSVSCMFDEGRCCSRCIYVVLSI